MIFTIKEQLVYWFLHNINHILHLNWNIPTRKRSYFMYFEEGNTSSLLSIRENSELWNFLVILALHSKGVVYTTLSDIHDAVFSRYLISHKTRFLFFLFDIWQCYRVYHVNFLVACYDTYNEVSLEMLLL